MLAAAWIEFLQLSTASIFYYGLYFWDSVISITSVIINYLIDIKTWMGILAIKRTLLNFYTW